LYPTVKMVHKSEEQKKAGPRLNFRILAATTELHKCRIGGKRQNPRARTREGAQKKKWEVEYFDNIDSGRLKETQRDPSRMGGSKQRDRRNPHGRK